MISWTTCLNSVETSILFTVEIESEGKLPFLDVLLEHEADRSISTTVCRKTTRTNRYLTHKITVIKTLLYQRLTLESIHIRSQSNPVNRGPGTMPTVYIPFI